MSPVIIILMGSGADKEHAGKVAAVATGLGVDVIQRVGSAHKTPGHVLEIIAEYEADPRPKVWVTIAGRSNALSAFVEAAVTAPVISCPPLAMPEDVWSSLRMPADVAPMVVLDPANARRRQDPRPRRPGDRRTVGRPAGDRVRQGHRRRRRDHFMIDRGTPVVT
jgi:5-(carboxyamino)imidazole ribonucleotide mutase